MNKTIAALAVIALNNLAAASPPPEVYPEKETKSDKEVAQSVEITEVGCMRTLLLLGEKTAPLEKLIAQRLTEVDFRVFPSARVLEGPPSSAQMREIGNENKADLVLFAEASVRPKKEMGDFQLFEGEATVQIFSPVSGEMMVSQTNRASGTRSVDATDAERSAIEKALDEATKTAISRGLDKARKIIVHRAVLTGVKDNDRLLTLMNYIAKMKGVYHVRQLSFDPKTHVAEIEILGDPQTETFWRAWLERMPRTHITTVTVKARPKVHAENAQFPPWFHRP